MPFAFQRRLAIPLWPMAFFTLALTTPPTATLFLLPLTTLFAMAAVGIAAMVYLMPDPMLTPATAGVATLDEPKRRAADDALDHVRMDDDGGLFLS